MRENGGELVREIGRGRGIRGLKDRGEVALICSHAVEDTGVRATILLGNPKDVLLETRVKPHLTSSRILTF